MIEAHIKENQMFHELSPPKKIIFMKDNLKTITSLKYNLIYE
jgi:hypothetical protein